MTNSPKTSVAMSGRMYFRTVVVATFSFRILLARLVSFYDVTYYWPCFVSFFTQRLFSSLIWRVRAASKLVVLGCYFCP